MTPSPDAEALLVELPGRGFPEAEIFEKRGRSRRFSRQAARSVAPPDGRTTQAAASEAGWALRAGDARRSLFQTATGKPAAATRLEDPSPHPLRLPEPPALPTPDLWNDPPELDAPLATETEATTLLAEIERELQRELPESRLVVAVLDDGASEWALRSTRGVRAEGRARAAYLRLEVGCGERRCRFEGAERDARQFEPCALARRLVDRLCALEESREHPAGASGESGLLLAAPLAARLVQAFAPFFLGPAARARLAALGALSPALTLIDDGRLATGLLLSPFDGEGLPCGRAVLVEEGRFVQPLLAWWEAGRAVPGCARRASWRDLPRRAPTHLFVAPGTTAVGELVESVVAGAYLLDAEGAVRVDPGSLAFEVPVSGMHIVKGRAVAPLGRVRLCGDLTSFLAGIQVLARDLVFVPGDGMFGAPTMRTSGLRVQPV